MIDLKTPLYRYIPYERFLEMLCFHTITVSSPRTWSDKYEEYVLRYTFDENKLNKLQDHIMRQNADEETAESLKRVQGLINYLFKRTFAICFSSVYDSEPLWRAYSGPGNAIMFVTTKEELLKLKTDAGEFESFVIPVAYDLENNFTIDDFLNSVSIGKGTASVWDSEQFFWHKRQIFEYEKEIRFICSFINLPKGEKNQNHVELKIPDLSLFIKGVMVNPNAKPTHVSTVERLCLQYSIPFLGKSKIYDLP